jgi:hypothetical protein
MRLIAKGSGQDREIIVPNLSRLCNTVVTRSAMTKTDCACIICHVAKARNNQHINTSQFLQDSRIPNGADTIEHPPCRICWAPLVPGTVHVCASKRDALLNLHEQILAEQLEQLTSKYIREKAAAASSSKVQLKTGGTPLTVTVGKTAESVKRNLFSHEDLFSMQKEGRLTDNQTRSLAKNVRVVAGKNAVESGLRQAQSELNQLEKDFFEVKNLTFQMKDDDGKDIEIVRPAVLCKDVMKLIRFIIKERDVNPNICLEKLNIDGRRHFFKIGFSLIESELVNLSPIKGKRMR